MYSYNHIKMGQNLRKIEPRHDKTNKMSVCPAKTHISLGIRPVWSVFVVRMKKAWVLSYPLSAQRRLWSDWADAMLIWVFAWRTVTLLVLSCRGSIVKSHNLLNWDCNIWASSCETLPSGFATRYDTNQPAQPQKLSWNFGYWNQMYYTIRVAKNKGADQTVQADLFLCCSRIA